MNYSVSNILEIARGEIGYHEKNSDANLGNKTAANDGSGNHTKYARDLQAAGYYNGNKCGYAWCDVFVDWLFFKLCGDPKVAQQIECQSGPYGAGCVWSASYYKAAGRYHTDNPQPGDQIFFGDFDHTGIIESVTDTTIVTIEGNTSNQVARRTYKRTDSYITGFGRPLYDAEDAVEPAPDPTPGGKKAEKGDVVTIAPGAVYWSGKNVPDWVQAKKWVVREVSGDRAVIDCSEDGRNAICSPIDVKYLSVVGAPAKPWVPQVGDIVFFHGDTHYSNANASSGPDCRPGKAKITDTYQVGKAKHPYHLIRTSDSDSTVYGWVDADDFTKA